jgi:hypothetical protein
MPSLTQRSNRGARDLRNRLRKMKNLRMKKLMKDMMIEKVKTNAIAKTFTLLLSYQRSCG